MWKRKPKSRAVGWEDTLASMQSELDALWHDKDRVRKEYYVLLDERSVCPTDDSVVIGNIDDKLNAKWEELERISDNLKVSFMTLQTMKLYP